MKNDLAATDEDLSGLSDAQKQSWRRYESVVEHLGIDPRYVLRKIQQETSFGHTDPHYTDMAADQLVRGQIVYEFTMIDYLLEYRICEHLLGPDFQNDPRRPTVLKLLDGMSLIKKAESVQQFYPEIKACMSQLQQVNGVRNLVAHTFDARDRDPRRCTYRGTDIFTVAGLEKFSDDLEVIHRLLHDNYPG